VPRPRSLAVAGFVIASAAVCVRLGFWQLSRLEHKRHLNAAMREALSLPPTTVTDLRLLPDSLLHRRVSVRGAFDERRQVLLAGRSHAGEPGVHVVTPLVTARDSVAVLVDRGWLPAADAATARPQELPVPGPREVVGIADTLAHRPGGEGARAIESDSVTVYSAVELDFDSLSIHFPDALARFYVRELPSPDAPAWPAREAPVQYEETMHLSYAIQWFAMATILVAGSAALARSRHRRTASGASGTRAQ